MEETSTTNFVANNKVYIMGEFDESICEKVVPGFTQLIDSLSNQKDANIDVYINSNGGEISQLYTMLALFQQAKDKGIKITTIITGKTYSCGSLLAICGECRKMFKYAEHLIHLGFHQTYSQTYKQEERLHLRVNRTLDRIVEIYKEHSKLSEKEIKKLMEDDACYMTAEECLKNGFVDEIIG